MEDGSRAVKQEVVFVETLAGDGFPGYGWCDQLGNLGNLFVWEGRYGPVDKTHPSYVGPEFNSRVQHWADRRVTTPPLQLRR